MSEPTARERELYEMVVAELKRGAGKVLPSEAMVAVSRETEVPLNAVQNAYAAAVLYDACMAEIRAEIDRVTAAASAAARLIRGRFVLDPVKVEAFCASAARKAMHDARQREPRAEQER